MIENNVITDVCVIGAGLSGLVAALDLSSKYNVTLISKSTAGMNASSYAQGGIAVSFSDDGANVHANDTIYSGDGLCDEEIVRKYVYKAKDAVAWLRQQGVVFNLDKDENLLFTKEGGHSCSRIVHSYDETGKKIMASLQKNVNIAPNIQVYTNVTAIDFVTVDNKVTSLKVLNNEDNSIYSIVARRFVLCSGGASGLYSKSTNPDNSLGDGISMAWRAGCSVANLEFNQFHPTCLYTTSGRPVLISEAVRGEGGILCAASGERFMDKYHPDGELATRDIVSRAMLVEMQRLGVDHLYLDISHKNAKYIKKRFPGLYRNCMSYGLDITKNKIPVLPSSHYSCGGVVVDENSRSSIENLYVVGECAYTGLHGANRLASNSLMECVVSAKNAIKAIEINMPITEQPSERSCAYLNDKINRSDCISSCLETIKKIMWDHVGIIRTVDGLCFAKKQLLAINAEVGDIFEDSQIDADLLELRSASQLALLTVCSAIDRKESRGGHYNLDFQKKEAKYDGRPTIIKKSFKTIYNEG